MKAGRHKPITAGANGRSKASALLDDQVYARIYQAIGGQELPPGTRLREDQMRQIFGVSRARIWAARAGDIADVAIQGYGVR